MDNQTDIFETRQQHQAKSKTFMSSIFSKSKHSEDSIILYTKENVTKVSFHFLINWKMKFKCLIFDFHFHTKLVK